MSPRAGILVWATVFLTRSATAHMIMQSPVPFSIDKLDNGPLSSGDFPCKQKIGYTISTMNEMAAGESQKLTFKGTAVHGGGSCQLAVTLDTEPTSSSTFKVIKSFEGACPGVDGGASEFNYTIPTSIPNGQATFAWTWFSKLSGAPEMYMNCAPITVSGGASDSSAFDALPDLFVANIPEASCTSPQNFDTKFPNAGSDVEIASGASLEDPTGSSCGSSSGNSSGGSSGGSGGVASSAASSPAASTATAATTSVAGGIFAPGASSAEGGVSSTSVASPPVVSTSVVPQPVETTAVAPTTVQTTLVSVTAPPASTGTGSSTGAACSTDGAVICNGSSQFGLCNHGQVVWQAVAAGTTCANGVISRRKPMMRVLRHKRGVHGHSF